MLPMDVGLVRPKTFTMHGRPSKGEVSHWRACFYHQQIIHFLPSYRPASINASARRQLIPHTHQLLFCKSISKLDLELSFFQLQDQSIQ
jgi:hypothetical protein